MVPLRLRPEGGCPEPESPSVGREAEEIQQPLAGVAQAPWVFTL